MKNRYTIIDNFDKFDASQVSDLREEVETIYDLSDFDDLENEVFNYNVLYNFASDFVYIPDMLRYIMNFRFFLKKDFSLGYARDFIPLNKNIKPPEVNLVPNSDANSNVFFDIVNPIENYNSNAEIFSNTLTFGQYYNPEFPIPDFLKSDIDIPKINNYLDTVLPPEKFTDADFWWYYTQTQRNYMLFSPTLAFNGNFEVDLMASFQKIKWHPLVNTEEWLGEMGYNFGVQNVLLDILQKLILWQNNTNLARTKHLYFVTDLAKSSNQFSKELEYIVNQDIVSIIPKYNFYAEYSEVIPDNVVSEWQLPNIYTYYSLRKKKSEYYRNLVRLGQSPENADPNTLSVQQYYEIVNNSNLPPLPPITENDGFPLETQLPTVYRYKNIVVNDKNFLNDANAIADLFPMYNKISIPSQDKSVNITKTLPNKEIITSNLSFAKIIDKNNLTDELITLLGNYFSSVRNDEVSAHKFVIHNGESGIKARASASWLQVFNVEELFKPTVGKLEKYFYDDKDVKFGFKKPSKPSDPLSGDSGNKSLSFYSIKKELEDFIKNVMLTVLRVYNGDKCYSEVVAFEIAKYKIINGVKTHLQSIFLPALFSGEEISYFDTQVFYNQEYIYEVFSHSLVVGLEYGFVRENLGENAPKQPWLGKDADDNTFNLPKVETILSKPKPIIVRAPYHNTVTLADGNLNEESTQKTTKINDLPPLPPDIVFYPYKDVDNKILVLLNTNYGERQMLPIPVFSEDKAKIEEERKYQNDKNNFPMSPRPFELFYKTDDATGTYEIYRTTTKPLGWEAFIDANTKVLLPGEGSGYNDIINPNVDYYYFARLVDIHGNTSNPTDIFHVRIVKEGGFPPRLISKVYSFPFEDPTYEKGFSKYLLIRLADGTRKLSNTNDVLSSNLSYQKTNPVNPELPGGQLKKYKIRITSRKTGKKIDINLDFKSDNNNTYFVEPVSLPGAPSGPPETPALTLKKLDELEEKTKTEGKLNDGSASTIETVDNISTTEGKTKKGLLVTKTTFDS